MITMNSQTSVLKKSVPEVDGALEKAKYVEMK